MKRGRQLKSMNITFVGEETTVKDIESTPQMRQIIFDELIPSVKEAIERNQDHSALFEINNSGFAIEIMREDWIASLKEAIIHFENKQEFEKCITIRDLIKSIYEQQRIRENSASNEQHSKRKNTNKEEKEKPSVTK